MGQENLIEAIRAKLGPAVAGVADSHGDAVLLLRPEAVRSALAALREAPFDYAVLLDLTCVDFAADEARLELVYHLSSKVTKKRITLKVSLPRWQHGQEGQLPEVASVSHIWRTADWHEREVYDLTGVRFI
ncbi:MAG: NADH-quinone oxidoreductase subunit C, partial [Candidatus Aminicenantes bacterium]|nr:NADH-quinone oxidoreductase subunit C [Candidatus Aminicenantes bacterium]